MRVACAQYAIRDGDPDTNLERSVAAILDAARAGANLVVLPELANSGCDLSSRESALEIAEKVGDREAPEGPTLQAWQRAARESDIFVVGGFLEREGDSLYNSAAVVGTNFFGRYRKTHLWNEEKLLYKSGRELPIFETPLCNIGVLVCYDAWFPEAARTLALRGADLLCIPANAPDDWVPEGQRRGNLTMLNAHAVSHANANRLFVACANRVEDGYLGRSCVVDTTGGVLAFGSATEEELVHAEIYIERARLEKHLTVRSHAFGDRNPEVYEDPLRRS
ncbi:MAG: Aliphatic amidase AmiE [uncultured Rubrobacteraceae bacterium]|uniref:Aliphatic amidase AmiE n=1 Tax=uncultured Rubrobacteraceae bacterium TaxID=349277 RepID=A0A6J4QQV1_9ACTN|nr:MAG: Aliphatic amidase AmiE [uncultured Rubrobacteraceae bacterium]